MHNSCCLRWETCVNNTCSWELYTKSISQHMYCTSCRAYHVTLPDERLLCSDSPSNHKYSGIYHDIYIIIDIIQTSTRQFKQYKPRSSGGRTLQESDKQIRSFRKPPQISTHKISSRHIDKATALQNDMHSEQFAMYTNSTYSLQFYTCSLP